MYNFLQDQQHANGSWDYSPAQRPFIDCFHSCFVLKNICKTDRLIGLTDSTRVVDRGYRYLKKHLWDEGAGLLRRFAVRNKPGIVRYDLYDTAEMMNLAILLGDYEFGATLHEAVQKHFVRDNVIFSKIDIFGRRRDPDMLRWAIMPYLYALSEFLNLHNVRRPLGPSKYSDEPQVRRT